MASLEVDAVKYYDSQLSATLTGSKTTGPGKRVRELPSSSPWRSGCGGARGGGTSSLGSMVLQKQIK